jgi:YfiR/HmsC-like
MKCLGHIVLFAALFLFLLSTPAVCTEQRAPDENEIKAAFVFNVARYVSWPHYSSNIFRIGVLGKGALSTHWSNLKGRTIHGKRVAVIKTNDLDDLLNCQIVYIESPDQKNNIRVSSALKHYPVLTISNTNGNNFATGMIITSLVNNRIIFSVNLVASRMAGLEISSNLAKLAAEVIK